MPTLYVTEQGATVRLSGGSLIVTVDDSRPGKEGHCSASRKILIEVEPHRIEVVTLIGRSHITSDATHLCLEQGICVAWFSWSGQFLGRTVPVLHRCADLRLAQYRAASDLEVRLTRAVAVVEAKLSNSVEILTEIQSNDSENKMLGPAIAEIRQLSEDVKHCDLIERLLGLEGAAARQYFKAYGASFRGEILFSGRHHRPAPDPANALLSFGYVLLANRIGGMMEARGLDPCLGFFHELRSGRESLALDLLEELRQPVIDKFVIRACNLRILRPEHFEPPDPEKGVRLTREGLKVFFEHWEAHLLRPIREKGNNERLATMELLHRQVDRIAASVRGSLPYQPFLYGK